VDRTLIEGTSQLHCPQRKVIHSEDQRSNPKCRVATVPNGWPMHGLALARLFAEEIIDAPRRSSAMATFTAPKGPIVDL
jgi:hypothetical protein